MVPLNLRVFEDTNSLYRGERGTGAGTGSGYRWKRGQRNGERGRGQQVTGHRGKGTTEKAKKIRNAAQKRRPPPTKKTDLRRRVRRRGVGGTQILYTPNKIFTIFV